MFSTKAPLKGFSWASKLNPHVELLFCWFSQPCYALFIYVHIVFFRYVCVFDMPADEETTRFPALRLRAWRPQELWCRCPELQSGHLRSVFSDCLSRFLITWPKYGLLSKRTLFLPFTNPSQFTKVVNILAYNLFRKKKKLWLRRPQTILWFCSSAPRWAHCFARRAKRWRRRRQRWSGLEPRWGLHPPRPPRMGRCQGASLCDKTHVSLCFFQIVKIQGYLKKTSVSLGYFI